MAHWERSVYWEKDKTPGKFKEAESLKCSYCHAEYKKEHVSPRWQFCPVCGQRLDKKEVNSNNE